MSYDQILFIVLNIFNTFIAAYFVNGFLKKRTVTLALYLSALLFHYTSIAVVYLLFDNAYLNSAINILALLALVICYAAPMRSRLLCVVFLIAFGISAELLTLVVIAGVSAVHPSAIISTPTENLYGLVISKIILFAIVKLMLLSQRRQSNHPIPLAYWITIGVFPLGAAYILITMGGILLYGQSTSSLWSILSISCILLAMNGMMYIVYDKLEEGYRSEQQRALLVQQNGYYEQQYKQALYNDRRLMTLRHDMKNQLITLLEYANENRLSELNAYGERLLGELGSTANIANSGVPAIDALINYKAAIAVQQGIKVQVHLSLPNDLVIDAIDIATLLGNMLDNAIDACLRLQTDRSIKIILTYSQCALRICVENTYDGVTLQKDGHYSSTKADTKTHGFGLSSIRAVVDKYHGSLIIDQKNNTFIVDAFLMEILRQSGQGA